MRLSGVHPSVAMASNLQHLLSALAFIAFGRTGQIRTCVWKQPRVVQENCQDVKAMVRGRHRMAYPVKGNWEGIYVLFSFLAQPSTAPKVQILLSNPPAGAEDNILRHMTLNY